ncbi:hypothetical protein J4416_02040 [Candidatus Pacearchaeota archaeon]|nr:hypothetical protein [Candidatus Pacearchaeota archaeon]
MEYRGSNTHMELIKNQKIDAPPRLKSHGLKRCSIFGCKKFLFKKKFLHRSLSLQTNFLCSKCRPHSKECGFRETLRHKKGVFFLAITMVIITLLMTSYTLHTKIQERKVVQKRVETMNSFVNSIQQDIERKLFIAGFRSIFTLENKLIQTGAYIENVNASFQEMFFNGTLDSQDQPIMVGATLTDLTNDLLLAGEKININVTATYPNLNIDQIDPWGLHITLDTQFSVTDNNNLSSWNAPLTITSVIPISYFDDPLYTIKTGGIVIVKFNQTIYSSFNSTSLLNHTITQLYKSSTQAPSFIDRLEGKIDVNSTNGIESLVDIQNLQSKGIEIEQKSIVDHIYFSSANPSFCHVSGMPSWFNLDNASLGSYNSTCG